MTQSGQTHSAQSRAHAMLFLRHNKIRIRRDRTGSSTAIFAIMARVLPGDLYLPIALSNCNPKKRREGHASHVPSCLGATLLPSVPEGVVRAHKLALGSCQSQRKNKCSCPTGAECSSSQRCYSLLIGKTSRSSYRALRGVMGCSHLLERTSSVRDNCSPDRGAARRRVTTGVFFGKPGTAPQDRVNQ